MSSHFRFEIEGTSVSYCYIRKNGCSAFKQLMADLANFDNSRRGAIDLMHERFGVQRIEDVSSAQWRVFVYRSPLDRIVSLFRNKLIMQEGASDFIHDFEQVSGMQAQETSFSTFVSRYLQARPSDPHTWAQRDHLLPVDYNAACTLQTLERTMSAVLGPALAHRYFAKPANASSEKLHDDPSFDTPVRVLRERWARSGELPSAKGLVDDVIEGAVNRLYGGDHRLSPRA